MSKKEAPHASALAEEGVVVIENYLEEEECDRLYKKITGSIEQNDIDVVDGGTYDYSELANWDGSVANKRQGRDEGMTDVFNIDEIVPEARSFKEDQMIDDLIDEVSDVPYSPDNVNVYWNRSVTTTRDFHADTYSGKFKSFLYLTDVSDRSFGPFSYIKGTHRSSKVKTKATSLVNKVKDKPSTDAVFYDEDEVEYFTAPKGTLIIANQAGYHRGHPQEEGKERMLMTTSYTPTE